MNRRNRILRKIILWAADLTVSLVSFALALQVRFGTLNEMPETRNLIILIIVLISIVIGFLFDLNRNYMGRGYLDELTSVILYNFILAIGMIVVFFVSQNSEDVSRLAIGYLLIFNVIGMYLERIIIKKLTDTIFGSEQFRKRLIIVTDQEHYEDVMHNFLTGYSFTVVGKLVADETTMKGTVEEKNVSAAAGDIPSEIVTTAFDDLFLDIPSLSKKRQSQIVSEFISMGVQVHLAVDLPVVINQDVTLNDFGINYCCAYYTAHHFNAGALAVKRLMDIAGGVVGLAITGILFFILGPMIKIDSKGPVLFSQTRVGRNGKRFKIYKFRSMTADAESRKADLMKQNQMQGLMFKMDDDPRVTKVGRFIRKTSLDEFPQFWNVLKGDMSLVGTRPPTEKEFLQYNAYYRARLTLRPGLTGMWQVSGRSDITDFDEVVRLDMEYINNWSLKMDLKILFKTVKILFDHKGAK